MSAFGSYISFGEPRTSRWEWGDGTLTISFWRVTICFANLDIENLFSEVLSELKSQTRDDKRYDRLKDKVSELEHGLKEEVEHGFDKQGSIDKLEKQVEDMDDDITDLEDERQQLKKTVDSERDAMHNLLVYLHLTKEE